MSKVLILGAGGQIARWVIDDLASDHDVELTLFARDQSQLTRRPARAEVVVGDVLDQAALEAAVQGQDVVYANLAGEVDQQARGITAAMTTTNVERLVFVTALGIYDEVPGEFGRWNRRQIGSVLDTYRTAADVIEESNLNYTVVRPAWLTNEDEIDYEVTHRGETFKGTEVSRRSVAALIASIIRDPERWNRTSLGVNKPGTDGPRPSFMQ